jgi:hypothetical protein
MTKHQAFDRSRLRLLPLSQRQHDLSLESRVPLDGPIPLPDNAELKTVARRIVEARSNDRAVVLAMGAHVLRAGVTAHLIDLMRRGFITHIACNGAAVIHDFEFALIGKTTESVARYIAAGQFGLWQETGRLNDIVARAPKTSEGLGELIGREIAAGAYPYQAQSLFAQSFLLGVPATVHVGIGYDIVFEHPNCDGAAWGAASYRDFLILAQSVTRLEGGVFINLGSAVMGPEVFLKALAMARNVAHQRGDTIRKFTTLVTDLLAIRGDWRREAPKCDPQYYYRPYKTILVRTVADGGESYYVQADHCEVVPTLYHRIREWAAR